jgi:divalent metal cation (Fe/Co/Zn/Cd) transporter
MKRIISSFVVGIVLALLGWTVNWIATGRVTYAVIFADNGEVLTFDYLLNPVLLPVFVITASLGLNINYNPSFQNDESHFRDMCITTPSLMLIVMTLIAGWKVSIIAIVPVYGTFVMFYIIRKFVVFFWDNVSFLLSKRAGSGGD